MSVANVKNFQPDQAIWLLIDDEPIAARFMRYEIGMSGGEVIDDPYCVCCYSDLNLKGVRWQYESHTFATRQVCLDYIGARNRELSAA